MSTRSESWAVLRLSGEYQFPVTPLRVPGAVPVSSADSLLVYDAVRLFAERARAARTKLFPPQALLHLAAGHLLLSERLAPACGLETGIHFLQIDSRASLLTLLTQLEDRPESYDRVRVRGRLAAEAHRASQVWPRIIGDLLADLRTFGTARTLQG